MSRMLLSLHKSYYYYYYLLCLGGTERVDGPCGSQFSQHPLEGRAAEMKALTVCGATAVDGVGDGGEGRGGCCGEG